MGGTIDVPDIAVNTSQMVSAATDQQYLLKQLKNASEQLSSQSAISYTLLNNLVL